MTGPDSSWAFQTAKQWMELVVVRHSCQFPPKVVFHLEILVDAWFGLKYNSRDAGA